MKFEIKPVYAGIMIAAVVVVIGWFFYKEAGNLGSLPPGAVGNPGPFAPGGAAVGRGGMPGSQTSQPGPPSAPRNP